MELDMTLLKEIMASNDEYWIVAKRTHYRECFRFKQGEDDILLIGIPSELRELIIGEMNIDDLTIGKAKKIINIDVDTNIFLSDDYPPFQKGFVFGDFYKGYPIVKVRCQDFLRKALELKSHDIEQYKVILDGMIADLISK